ncbi:MAG TPA: AsmA family protein [Nevskiaceae bacterium]
MTPATTNNLLRVGLGVLVTVVVLLIAAVIFVAVFFDANHYRDEIVARLEQQTGRPVTLDEIHLSLFPTLGLTLRNASLGNLRGFEGAPLVRVGEADVGVRLAPLLFEHRLAVEAVSLSGVDVALQRNARGVGNWAGLVAHQARRVPEAGGGEKGAASTDMVQTLALDSVSIAGGSVRYIDRRSGRELSLDDLDFRMGAIASNRPSTFSATFRAASDRPAVTTQATLAGRVTVDLKQERYAVQGLSLRVEARGRTLPAGAQDVRLNGDLAYDGRDDRLQLAGITLEWAGTRWRLSGAVTHLRRPDARFSGPLRLDPFKPRELLATLGVSAYRPRGSRVLDRAGLEGELQATRRSVGLKDARITVDGTTLRGDAAVEFMPAGRAYRFDLQGDDLDADDYLPAPAAARPGSVAAREATDSKSAAADALPFTALEHLDARGSVELGKLTAHGLHMTDVRLQLTAHPSAATRLQANAHLYGGRANSTTTLTPGAPARLGEELRIEGVQLGDLLRDGFQRNVVSGKADVTARLTAVGANQAAVRRSLGGQVRMSIVDGAVRGFDLGRILRQADVVLKPDADGGPVPVSASEKTDFSTVTASGRIHDGVLTSDDLRGSAPLLRLAGAGTVNLADETIDYTLEPTLVNTATGQGGKTLSQLRGVSVPVRLTGPWSAIRYQPDLKAALRGAARQEVERQLQRHGVQPPADQQELRQRLDKELQRGLKKLLGGH